jgi:hypothetical protein
VFKSTFYRRRNAETWIKAFSQVSARVRAGPKKSILTSNHCSFVYTSDWFSSTLFCMSIFQLPKSCKKKGVA